MVFAMARDDIISFNCGLGKVTLRCDSGLIWVTVSGKRTDYILSAGEELTISKKSRVVVMAETSSSVRFWRPVTSARLLSMGFKAVMANTVIRDPETCLSLPGRRIS